MDNLCPQPNCRKKLDLHSEGEFDTWTCPAGHGFAATVTELWGQAQDDEIKAIWSGARTGTPSALLSPGLGTPMVTVTITPDADEVEGNTVEGAPSLTLDVAVDEQFVWFDLGEWDAFTADLPNPEPSAEELKTVNTIASNFVNAWAASAKKRDDQGFEHLANVFAKTVDPDNSKSRGLSKVMPGKSPDEVAAEFDKDK